MTPRSPVRFPLVFSFPGSVVIFPLVVKWTSHLRCAPLSSSARLEPIRSTVTLVFVVWPEATVPSTIIFPRVPRYRPYGRSPYRHQNTYACTSTSGDSGAPLRRRLLIRSKTNSEPLLWFRLEILVYPRTVGSWWRFI